MSEFNCETVIDDLFSAAEKALLIRMETDDAPAVLYHFTDAAGLIGILNSQSLWASRAKSLNDASEIRYGIEMATKYLQEVAAATDNRSSREFLETTLRYLCGQDTRPVTRLDIETFVVSFCADTERSGQWLHYGRSGTGYALGLDSNGLQNEHRKLIRVLYQIPEQQRLVGDAVALIQTRFLGLAEGRTDDDQSRIVALAADICSLTLRALVSRLKHPSFAEEKEWRLVFFDYRGKGIQEDPPGKFDRGFRASGSRIIPYLIVPYRKFGGLPLSEIILGYGVDLEAAVGAIRYILRNEEFNSNVLIGQSTVPVR